MATGTEKWLNDAKGYGFITPDGGGEDLFAHFSAINMPGFRSLKEGHKVQFAVTKCPKGRAGIEYSGQQSGVRLPTATVGRLPGAHQTCT